MTLWLYGIVVLKAEASGAGAMPEVTVVIPLYDGERFLEEALESLIIQCLPVAEIIVVDDGSSDNGPEIAESLGARVIRQRNRGVSAARNTAILAARTEWIACIDQDDVWDRDKNLLQCQAIAHTNGASLAFTDFSRFGDPAVASASFLEGLGKEHYDAVVRRPVIEHASACEHATFVPSFARGLFFFPSTLMIKRELAIAAGLFDEGLHYWGDYEFLLRALRRDRGPIVVVERAAVGHRDHGENASLQDLEMLLDPVRVADRVFARPESVRAGGSRNPPGTAAR